MHPFPSQYISVSVSCPGNFQFTLVLGICISSKWLISMNQSKTAKNSASVLTDPINMLAHHCSRPDILGMIPVSAGQHKQIYFQILGVILVFLLAVAGQDNPVSCTVLPFRVDQTRFNFVSGPFQSFFPAHGVLVVGGYHQCIDDHGNTRDKYLEYSG